MDVEKARKLLLALPHVVETMQWGENLVFWVGDKAIGGKMFALVNLDTGRADGEGHGVISFAAGAERFAELVECDGLKPAPYFARIFWVAAQRWSAVRDSKWAAELLAAHALTLEKLPKGVREILAMPERERAKLVATRKQQLAAQAEKKTREKSGGGTRGLRGASKKA